MLGTKIYKENLTQDLYTQCAEWCNETGTATIEDKGDYYEVIEILPHILTPEEIQANLTQAVQDHMDKTAQERRYDDIFTAVSYVNSSDPVFAAEASALLLWRDQVWRLCYTMLDEVKAGVRPIPSVTELLAELPKFEWPEV